MKNFLTAGERMAVRSRAGRWPMSGEVSKSHDVDRTTGGHRYNTLRIVSGYRREALVRTELTDEGGANYYRSLTLPRRPTCRGCGQLLEGGQPFIRFDFWAPGAWEPTDSYLHDMECPSTEGES